MTTIVIVIGLIIGLLLSLILRKVFLVNIKYQSYLIIFISTFLFLISFFKFGLGNVFIKAVVLDSILIVVFLVDFHYKIIPNIIVFVTLFTGTFFVLFSNTSIISTLIGMLIGGGILFLLALVPKAMGGGDIKLMFALGLFLTPQKVIETLLLAFIFAALISSILLIFKIKGPKDHIPFGPFLALGCFITFHFFT